MDFLEILRTKAFLGREFLTWLWFKSDQSGGRVEISGKKFVEVLFLDKMTLDLSETDTPQTVSLKGEQSELREGLAALREGKKIEEARISLRSFENEFTTVIKGSWFCFGSFKTPPILPSKDMDPEETAEAGFLEKIYLVEEGMTIIDALFETFLDIRISNRWDSEELPTLRKWVQSQD